MGVIRLCPNDCTRELLDANVSAEDEEPPSIEKATFNAKANSSKKIYRLSSRTDETYHPIIA